jgi:hypothetical protein|tara:strand:- start:3470 stop:3658 length:189 start_codon:yes stop_codon:yes gene_type:complete
MNEIIAAIVGAIFSMLMMTFSNISNRRQKTTVEIFARLNKLEKQVAVLLDKQPRKRDWRGNL